MIEVINTYRSNKGKPWVNNLNRVVSDYCRAHNFAMSKKGEIYHAEPHYLNGWAEIVASCGFESDYSLTAMILVYQVIDSSEEHRNILLNCNTIAYDLLIDNWRAYLTIRCI